MAEGIVISTLANCAVTEFIKEVRTCLKAAKRCKSECRKLEKELKVIEPDVEKIEKRLAFLQRKCNGHHYEDLKMVEDWLERLKDAMQLANIAVRQCNSGNRLLKCKLSERITSAYESIIKAADNRLGYFLQLNNLTIPEKPRPVPCYESPGKTDLLRMSPEKNESLRREDLTRLPMSSTSSHNIFNYRYGSPIFSQYSSYPWPESSSFNGKESSVYESSESPHWLLMSQQRNVWMTQERNESLRREDLTRHSMNSSSSHSGRYGSPIFSQYSSYPSSESSSFNGKESSVYESSESPHWLLMSQQRNVLMTQERNESWRLKDLTRCSMGSSSSHSGRYGSPKFSQDSSYHSPESSCFYGKESSVHESSESPHWRLLSQQRNEIPQREDRTRSPLGNSHQMERLYTSDSSIVPQHQHYVPTYNSSSMPYYAQWNTSQLYTIF